MRTPGVHDGASAGRSDPLLYAKVGVGELAKKTKVSGASCALATSGDALRVAESIRKESGTDEPHGGAVFDGKSETPEVTVVDALKGKPSVHRGDGSNDLVAT